MDIIATNNTTVESFILVKSAIAIFIFFAGSDIL